MISDNVFIHIGYHKSGSTFLQKSVFPLLHVNYLNLGFDNRLVLNKLQSQEEIETGYVKKLIQTKIIEQYNNNLKMRTILSHEELSGQPHGNVNISPYRVAQNLYQAFPQAKIIICIRNQFDYLVSLYTFRIALKGYETRSFNKFLKEESNKGLFEHIEYHYLIAYYQKLFGNGNVLVLPAEFLFRAQVEALYKLSSFIGVYAPAISTLKPENKSTRNIYLLNFWKLINCIFMIFINLLRFLFKKQSKKNDFRKIRFFYYGLKRKVTGLINKNFPNAKEIKIHDYEGYQILKERYKKSNKRLSKLIDIDLSALGYPMN